VRQPERLPHAAHQRLEDLIGAQGGRDFLEDVEQQIARPQRVARLARLEACPHVPVEPRAQLRQMHRHAQHVLRAGEQRFRRRRRVVFGQNDEHRRARVGGARRERAHLLGEILHARVGRVEQQVGRLRAVVLGDLEAPAHEQPLESLGPRRGGTNQQDRVSGKFGQGGALRAGGGAKV